MDSKISKWGSFCLTIFAKNGSIFSDGETHRKSGFLGDFCLAKTAHNFSQKWGLKTQNSHKILEFYGVFAVFYANCKVFCGKIRHYSQSAVQIKINPDEKTSFKGGKT